MLVLMRKWYQSRMGYALASRPAAFDSSHANQTIGVPGNAERPLGNWPPPASPRPYPSRNAQRGAGAPRHVAG